MNTAATSDASTPEPIERDAVLDDPARPTRVRSPMTPIRLVAAGAFLLASALLVVATGGDHSSFGTAAESMIGPLPKWVSDAIVTTLQSVLMLAPILCAVALLVARFIRRLMTVFAAAGGAAAFLVLVASFSAPGTYTLGPTTGGWLTFGSWFSSLPAIAAFTAALVVESPWISLRTVRAGRSMIGVAVAARLLSAFAEPSTLMVAVGSGWFVGQTILFAIGSPNTRPRRSEVTTVLARFGYNAASITDAVADEPGFAAMIASDASGRRLLVTTLCRESWRSLFPTRLARWIRFRDVGDHSPFTTMAHRVDQEALGALRAFVDSIPTPRLDVSATVGADARLLAYDITGLTPLEALGRAAWTDDLLRSIWRTVATIRSNHVVHRRLSTSNMMVDPLGRVYVADFSAAELAAPDSALGVDVAEVLAATSSKVGVERAVRAALPSLGSDGLAAALPRLQPLALTEASRTALKAVGGVEQLAAEVQRISGAPHVTLEKLQRVNLRAVATIVMIAIAGLALIPQFVGAGDVWHLVLDANLGWAAGAVALSMVTYVAAAIAFEGSLPESLPLGCNIQVQFATSFVAVAATAASMALSARFLHKRGIDAAVAVGAVGVNTIAGVVVHLGLVVVFLGLGGTGILRQFHVHVSSTSAMIGLVVVGVIGGSTLIPAVRNRMRPWLLEPARRAALGLRVIVRSPTKMGELFGGSIAITLGYVLAMLASAEAFGSDVPAVSIALVYLVGSVVSSAAPTPGGLGAVEAALVAGLTSAGMAADQALGTVMLFRVATFWLPLLPGWFAFRSLQRLAAI